MFRFKLLFLSIVLSSTAHATDPNHAKLCSLLYVSADAMYFESKQQNKPFEKTKGYNDIKSVFDASGMSNTKKNLILSEYKWIYSDEHVKYLGPHLPASLIGNSCINEYSLTRINKVDILTIGQVCKSKSKKEQHSCIDMLYPNFLQH